MLLQVPLTGLWVSASRDINMADDSRSDDKQLNPALFAWLVVSEALARHEDPERAWCWLSDQLRLAAWNRPSVYDSLQASLQTCWSSVLPILMLPARRRQDFMHTYQHMFGFPHHDPIYTLLSMLWERYGTDLFYPGEWLEDIKNPERYSAPEQVCIVKLGLTLKWLAGQSSGAEHVQWEEWQSCLKRGVLHRLPERIKRGLAPDSPTFEDIVLALLAVAEWLTFEQTWRISTFLSDTDLRNDERLSNQQKVLAGALYGWERGYRRVGNMVLDRQRRAVLSRQALCIAEQNANADKSSGPILESVVLHSTELGTLSAFLTPFVELGSCMQQEFVQYDVTARTEKISRIGHLDVQVAQNAFAFHLELP